MQSRNELERSYCFWYSLRNKNQKPSDYEDIINKLCTFSTVEEFWQVYSHLKKPDFLPVNSEYHVFQEGIKPMWEDEANKNGGRWILRIKKGAASAFWEELLLCMIGEQFDVTNDICGIDISVRAGEDILSVWIRSGQDESVIQSVRDTLRKIWKLNESVFMEYNEHPKVQNHPPPKISRAKH